MAANEITIDVNADTKKARSKLDSFKKSARNTGLALTAMGAAGALAIRGFVNAALEQERAFSTLGAAVNATGVSFESVRGRIEATTAALQKKTNFGDEEQARVLARMVPILGSVDKAMEALPLVMDAASASGLNIQSVAGTLSRALSGMVHTSESIGVTFDENATFSERMVIGFSKVGGAAEANADPMIQMNKALSDVSETIGEALMPVVLPLIEKITSFAESLQKVNPSILKWGALILAAATSIALIVGPLLLLSSTLAGPLVVAIGAVKVAMLALIGSTGIGLVVVLLATLFMAWQTNFGGIQEITAAAVKFMKEKFVWLFGNLGGWIDKLIGGFNDLFGTAIPPIGDMIDAVKDKATEAIATVKEFVFPKQVRTDLIASGIHIDQNKEKMKKLKEETDETGESTKKLHDETANLMALVAGGFKEASEGDIFRDETRLGAGMKVMHEAGSVERTMAGLQQLSGEGMSALGGQVLIDLQINLSGNTMYDAEGTATANVDAVNTGETA